VIRQIDYTTRDIGDSNSPGGLDRRKLWAAINKTCTLESLYPGFFVTVGEKAVVGELVGVGNCDRNICITK